MVSKEQWAAMCVRCRCGHPAHFHTGLVDRTVCCGCACSEFQPMPHPDYITDEEMQSLTDEEMQSRVDLLAGYVATEGSVLAITELARWATAKLGTAFRPMPMPEQAIKVFHGDTFTEETNE